MKHYLGFAWTAVRLTALAATAALLAGCIITSKTELVTDAEASQILPAKAYLTGYDEDGANTWKMSDDGPQEMTLTGNTYASADGSLKARFVPLESTPGTYLVGLLSTDGTMVYGVAEYKNDVLAMHVVLGDPDPMAVIKDSNVPELQTIETPADPSAGLVITTREQLDALVQLYLNQKLSLMELVLYAADSPSAELPARIIYQDGQYREE